jgi:hypothetical protein
MLSIVLLTHGSKFLLARKSLKSHLGIFIFFIRASLLSHLEPISLDPVSHQQPYDLSGSTSHLKWWLVAYYSDHSGGESSQKRVHGSVHPAAWLFTVTICRSLRLVTASTCGCSSFHVDGPISLDPMKLLISGLQIKGWFKGT